MIYTNANIKNSSLGIVMQMQQSVLLKGNATITFMKNKKDMNKLHVIKTYKR